MRVLIADDDPVSKNLLSHIFKLLPEYEIVGEVSNGNELIQLAGKEKPDIVLVDINMPGINGVDAAKACKELLPSLQVIFTTGFDEFAVQAFNMSAADYIIKPIEKVRLFIALEKAKRSLQLHEVNETRLISKSKLEIKSNNNLLYIPMEDILYIEKEGRKLILHTENDRFETLGSLQEMAERLPEYFFKTHRSFLVNLRKIVKIESFGETYLASFAKPEKVAYVSKLKINEVHRKMGT